MNSKEKKAVADLVFETRSYAMMASGLMPLNHLKSEAFQESHNALAKSLEAVREIL